MEYQAGVTAVVEKVKSAVRCSHVWVMPLALPEHGRRVAELGWGLQLLWNGHTKWQLPRPPQILLS